MSQGLREFDDSRGRCHHCGKLIFKGESWVIPQYMLRADELVMAHSKCDSEYMARTSQI